MWPDVLWHDKSGFIFGVWVAIITSSVRYKDNIHSVHDHFQVHYLKEVGDKMKNQLFKEKGFDKSVLM